MRTDRYRRPVTIGFACWCALALIVLPVATSARIVVVEEDRDRHRYLHGSKWYLEVVFYRTQTLDAADRDATFQFGADGVLTAETACGGFTGFYTSEEDGTMAVTGLEADSACESDASTRLVMDGLQSARTFDVDGKALRIHTADNGYLSFATE